MIFNIYKIIIIIFLILLIKSKFFTNDHFNSVDYKNLTDEQKRILDAALKKQESGTKYLASTDIEAILNVSNIIKNGSVPIPVGTIVAYYSTQVPQGWALCNGQTVNGHKTPDLRNRFIVSTGNKYRINSTGGNANAVVVSHNHSMEKDGRHTHLISASTYNRWDMNKDNRWYEAGYADNTSDYWGAVAAHGSGKWHTNLDKIMERAKHNSEHKHKINNNGESGTNKNLPPYYALTYIMKV
jgi:microcystin-dependent protein